MRPWYRVGIPAVVHAPRAMGSFEAGSFEAMLAQCVLLALKTGEHVADGDSDQERRHWMLRDKTACDAARH